ncbi:MAG TPA: rRNA maturation RNase YbeY [Candidatus Acidoferrum sp.]|nr:rRNA maturation RNase YbeY [Candidatus Acidoferrum sp.]
MILNRQRAVRLARGPLEAFLRRVKRELGVAKSGVTVCLMSDAEIARLNRDFRGKQGPTDVLSFPEISHSAARPSPTLATRHSPLTTDLGDIAISPETARRYAKKHGRRLPEELRVLILHGVLHLLGYDHETDSGEMDRIERKLRKRFGLA